LLTSGDIVDRLKLEVVLDVFGLVLHAAQVPGGNLDPLQTGARRCEPGDGLLQISAGHLVGVELRAVAGQEEHLGSLDI